MSETIDRHDIGNIAVIPSGSTMPIAAIDESKGYFVECIDVTDSPYKHNDGIVAFIVGDEPDELSFVIRNGKSQAHLGEYTPMSKYDVAERVTKVRYWVQVPAVSAPQRRSQSRTAATAPQSPMHITPRVLIGTTASLHSQLHV
jgi:hypothetical protein